MVVGLFDYLLAWVVDLLVGWLVDCCWRSQIYNYIYNIIQVGVIGANCVPRCFGGCCLLNYINKQTNTQATAVLCSSLVNGPYITRSICVHLSSMKQ